ncbi:helix-turn-helix domain-containing protein [Streptomyces durmitorensis]|uniref:Helix-turn-helix domain-containing protein n=1 Tax=Streptomyces durmitorensis TaxID=319947 RepID=A0ABY4Q7G9_9ACTN|nr:helix-turn-helix domain-containing protein [Streptomyces durmitorensis]UQT61086.1 helix-turn-helix domain-containing protein [Streptomyces durmitorensis]
MRDNGEQLLEAQLGGLLREVRRQASCEAGPDVCRMLDWLHRQTGVHAAVVAQDAGTVEASTAAFPQEVLSELAGLLARLCGGQLAAAATQTQGLHVRCEALGPHGPRPVLVVAAGSQPTAQTVALTSHTGSVLALLRRAEAGQETRRVYDDKARQLRFAVLHGLLAGGPLLARRMTTGVVPPLLDADRLRIHLLRCPSADRDRIAQAHQDPSGYHGSALIVHCPVFKEHLICLIAEDDETNRARDGVSHGPAPGLAETLRRLVRDNPRYALGISGVQPLHATAEAYSQAAHALAGARTTAGRVAFHQGQTSLAGLLPVQPALAWARAFLRPLDAAPKTSADITRLATSMPRSGVARLLGLSRNTVTAHLRRAQQALGQDLADVRCRAAVHLALALVGSGSGPEPDGHHVPPALEELLSTEPAAAWAQTVLRPLQPRHRRTLQAWIDANADAQQTAHRMGISRNTVRAHLRTAEAALGLDLLTTGTGTHHVVHALHIAAGRATQAI